GRRRKPRRSGKARARASRCSANKAGRQRFSLDQSRWFSPSVRSRCRSRRSGRDGGGAKTVERRFLYCEIRTACLEETAVVVSRLFQRSNDPAARRAVHGKKDGRDRSRG